MKGAEKKHCDSGVKLCGEIIDKPMFLPSSKENLH